MRAVHERVVRVLSGALGLFGGMLSALALGVVALAGPLIGLLAVLTAPVRALVSWLRRARGH
jgi:hypothetical protein